MEKYTQDELEILEVIGKRLRFERKIRNLSQEEMAFRLGISDRQLRRYEKGVSSMSPYTIYKLYWDFEISVDFLVSGEFCEDDLIMIASHVMPRFLVEKLFTPLLDYQDRISEFVNLDKETVQKHLKILGTIASYGKMHKDDEKLRDPIPGRLFQFYHIFFGVPFLPINYMASDEEIASLTQ